MATQIVVEKRIYFKVLSVTDDEWYYIVPTAALSDVDIKAELKKRGYIEIEERYNTIAWP
jgi:hypothetical protein